MMTRYVVKKGSQSHHCCFEATVIDMTKPFLSIVDDQPLRDINGELQYASVCECFDMDDAQRVCDALNASGAD